MSESYKQLKGAAGAAMAAAFQAVENLPREQAIDVSRAALQVIWESGRYSIFSLIKEKCPNLLRGDPDEVEIISIAALRTIRDLEKAAERITALMGLFEQKETTKQ